MADDPRMSNQGNKRHPLPYAEIVVVRHGETTWNASAKIQGHLDVELNEVGRQQATATADRLSKESHVSAVYTSDLKRASETAEIIAKSCNLPEVIRDPELRERHLGDLQGLVYHDIAKLNPKAYQAFCSHKSDQEIPGGGESLDQLHLRCTSALERIAKKHTGTNHSDPPFNTGLRYFLPLLLLGIAGERVVVVSHGGSIREFYKRAAPRGLPMGKVMNASVNVFHISENGDAWIIKTWGDISHLKGSGFLNNAFGGDGKSG
ncbi:hypothetical protein QJS04_geneDACA011980 [Acorus gramineus]|uniref:Phosphoglycerate mutase n=1 Tax=Acorus gramineus TaxID=55184 RepID=A0AAV9AIE2_ACOGR|nr:hypothetical protein QJS04_geneDACA011980 [Acorus gramineus]